MLKNILAAFGLYFVAKKGYCSGQAIPDSGLSFFSATAGGSPSLA